MGRQLFLDAARGDHTRRPPVWLMRQAGRYLPEYREIRSEHSFLEAIKSPEIATEISLQPYERFPLDAVVMFSDILTVLEPLGFEYHLESGVGPVVENPVTGPDDVDRPTESVRADTAYVAALLDRLDDRVDDAAVLGFAGGPFTLASYAVEGEPSRSKMAIRRLRAEHPAAFETLLQSFTDAVIEYLQMQVEHGADAVQLFDTYAGMLGQGAYRESVVPLHRAIVDSVDVPTIVFARNMGGRLDLLAETGADVVGLDWTVNMAGARAVLGETPVQGNLDPAALFGDEDRIRERTETIIEAAGPQGHILNLGHGVNRETPVSAVETFVETARQWSWD
ncbi:MAG: uroporphyrinogen decarboxylase [Halobacteriaceae archaeon]